MAKQYFGMYQSIVTNVKDPEKRGRIKVTIPEILDDTTESAWCEPCVPVAYDSGGDFCIPQVDEAVWVQFIAGDINRPVYLGGWWSENKTPLGSSYTNLDKTRIISFNDCTITLTSDKIEISVKDGVDLEIKDKKVTVKGDLSVTGNLSVGGNTSVSGSLHAKSISSDTN